MNEYYDKIVQLMNAKAKVFHHTFLEFSRLKISPNKVVIFDLNTGAIHVTETAEIIKQTDLITYFYGKDEPNEKITEPVVRQLISEIENINN